MRHLRTYEQIITRELIKPININNINVGDWGILYYQQSGSFAKKFEEYSTTHPVKIIKIFKDDNLILLDYENYPKELNIVRKFPRTFHISHLMMVSPNKEDIEIYIQSNKYNL